ncbi:hypothetical protein ACFL1H_07895, partial [Nanoarchaeota archaeon]
EDFLKDILSFKSKPNHNNLANMSYAINRKERIRKKDKKEIRERIQIMMKHMDILRDDNLDLLRTINAVINNQAKFEMPEKLKRNETDNLVRLYRDAHEISESLDDLSKSVRMFYSYLSRGIIEVDTLNFGMKDLIKHFVLLKQRFLKLYKVKHEFEILYHEIVRSMPERHSNFVKVLNGEQKKEKGFALPSS